MSQGPWHRGEGKDRENQRKHGLSFEEAQRVSFLGRELRMARSAGRFGVACRSSRVTSQPVWRILPGISVFLPSYYERF